MPTRNLYFPDPIYKAVSQLAEDLNLPINDTFRELVTKGLEFYKRNYSEEKEKAEWIQK